MSVYIDVAASFHRVRRQLISRSLILQTCKVRPTTSGPTLPAKLQASKPCCWKALHLLPSRRLPVLEINATWGEALVSALSLACQQTPSNTSSSFRRPTSSLNLLASPFFFPTFHPKNHLSSFTWHGISFTCLDLDAWDGKQLVGITAAAKMVFAQFIQWGGFR